ncbi:MAG: DUF1476 domain-containing protein [Alphaproteobacteria bacterium]|nr:DUF1476 domain-containing protein [Alphaproteobacteria bacterium]
MSWERDREKGYETQFARQEEAAFKAAAHRNRLLAEWAAQLMGLRHREAEGYIKTLITGDVAHLRGRAIIDTIVADLSGAGVTMSEDRVAAMFDRLDAQARAELARG